MPTLSDHTPDLPKMELNRPKGSTDKQIGGDLAGQTKMKLNEKAMGQLDLINSGSWATEIATKQVVTHPKKENPIQIFIKTLEGKTVCWRICEGRKIQELKNKIQNQLGIPAHRRNLICLGHRLQDHHTLKDYGINAETTIIINRHLRGGSVRASSKSTGSFKEAVKGKGQPHVKSAAPVELPRPYIVEQKSENPTLTIAMPEEIGRAHV